MTQNAQKRVLQDFRQGQFNTLVATCIAEEGLDIPEVQLIVCFDGAASPLRDTQRMGRTGRHETGRVVYLLNQGKEQRKFDKNNNETGYVKALLARAIYHFELYEPNPMMIPRHFKPEMKMIHMQTTDPKASTTNLVCMHNCRDAGVFKCIEEEGRRIVKVVRQEANASGCIYIKNINSKDREGSSCHI